MAGPMEGIKVVELGFWVAGPSCGAILADWGADVVKAEPLTGDPFRGMKAAFQAAVGQDVNPPFELDNRGKRSIGLDYGTDRGRRVLEDLVGAADVFVTNLRLDALERAGLDHATLTARHPRLVYASVSGLGLEGAERHRAAYDVGSFWSRAGVAAALSPDASVLPVPTRRHGRPHDRHGGGRRGGGGAVRAGAHRRGPARQHLAAPHRCLHARLGHQHQPPHGAADEGDDPHDGAQPADRRLRRERRQAVLAPGPRRRPALARPAEGRGSARSGG